jgi:hypothetical protein
MPFKIEPAEVLAFGVNKRRIAMRPGIASRRAAKDHRVWKLPSR